MTQIRNKPFIIAGGGIGGLATALGLAQKGIRSIVLERAPELGEIGAGIHWALTPSTRLISSESATPHERSLSTSTIFG